MLYHKCSAVHRVEITSLRALREYIESPNQSESRFPLLSTPKPYLKTRPKEAKPRTTKSKMAPRTQQGATPGSETWLKALRNKLQKVYEEAGHENASEDKLDYLFSKYKGRENQLYKGVCEKYKLDIDPITRVTTEWNPAKAVEESVIQCLSTGEILGTLEDEPNPDAGSAKASNGSKEEDNRKASASKSRKRAGSAAGRKASRGRGEGSHSRSRGASESRAKRRKTSGTAGGSGIETRRASLGFGGADSDLATLDDDTLLALDAKLLGLPNAEASDLLDFPLF